MTSPFFYLVALMLAASGVQADTIAPPSGTHWEFYAYGNAEAMKAAFTALAGIVASSTFKTICMILAIGGFAAAGGTALIGGNPTKLALYVVGLILLVYGTFSLKMDIYIQEMVYVPGAAPQFQLVDNVPGAIALPMVAISKISKGISDFIGTYMTTANGVGDIPNASLPFGAGMGIAQDMSKIRIANGYLRKNYSEWVANCVAPRIYSGQINMSQMANSPDIMQYLGGTLAGTSVTQFMQMTYLNGSKTVAGNGETNTLIRDNQGILNCMEAYQVLNEQIRIEVGGSIESISARVSPQLVANGILNAGVAGKIAEQVAGASMGNATTLATQGAVIDLMQGSTHYQAQALDVDASMLALNTNNAARSQKTGWYTASVLFRDMGGYFYAILQVFLIAISPMIAAMMFIPGMGGKLGSSYMKACLWLATWWPSLQIVNFIMELYYQSSAQASFGAAGGLSMVNQGLVSQFNDNMIIAAGFMATLVPTIMWGIVNGTGMALTSVLERAGGGSYASSAAQDAAAGNFRASNVGMNSFSANKWDNSITHATGTQASEWHQGAGSTETRNNFGGVGSMINTQAITSQYSKEASIQHQNAIAQQTSAKESFSSQNSSVAKQALSDLSSVMKNGSRSKDGTITFSDQDSYDKALQSMSTLAQAYQTAKEAGLTTSIDDYISKNAEGKIDASFVGLLNSGVTFKAGQGQNTSEKTTVGFKTQQTESGDLRVTDSNGRAIQSSKSIQGKTADTLTKSGISTQSYTAGKELTQMLTAAKSLEIANTKVDQATEALKESHTTTVPMPVNANTARAQIESGSNAVENGLAPNVVPVDHNAVNAAIGKATGMAADIVLGTNPKNTLALEGNNGTPITKGGVVAEAGSRINEAESEAGTRIKETSDNHANKALADQQARLAKLDSRNQDIVKTLLETRELDLSKFGDSADKRINTQMTGKDDKTFENGVKLAEAKHILDKGFSDVSGFSINGQVFTPSGIVGGFGGHEYEMVYRQGANDNDARYYTVTGEGKLQELNVSRYNNDQAESSFTTSQANNLSPMGRHQFGNTKETYSPIGNNFEDITGDNVGSNQDAKSQSELVETNLDRKEEIATSGIDDFMASKEKMSINQKAYSDEAVRAAEDGNALAKHQRIPFELRGDRLL